MLSLAPHVHACVCGDLAVFLDLKADRYRAISTGHIAEIGIAIAGLPVAPVRGLERGAHLLERLRTEGLVIEQGACLRGPAAPRTAQCDRSSASLTRALPDLSECARFVLAMVEASRALARPRMDRIIEAARRRRPGLRAEAERAAALAGIYEAARPYYPARRVCLLDSLSLHLFLARSGIGADWVFGVRTKPFAAHCWVEADGIVLNDSLDHAASFTPILVV